MCIYILKESFIIKEASDGVRPLKNERPIVEALTKFTAKKPYSLHVPGHKHGALSSLPHMMKQCLRYDLTELTGLDDFHQPEEAIKQAEQLLSETYNSDKSFFLVNGSTVGNLAMIYAVCHRNDEVLVQRNAHKSIFHALELVGAKPIYLTPVWDDHVKSPTYISTNTLKEALSSYPNVKAVILTYPTYYGVISKELQKQIEICHEQNIPVLVDEAHGAHFPASNLFPPSALQLGADVVVQSAHKTLPAMTMASFLHVKSNIVDANEINEYLRKLQSSSPSYLLLASLDDARYYVETYLQSDVHYLLEKRRLWIESLKSIKNLEVIEVDDPLKVCLRVKGHSGYQLKEALEKYKFYVELADLYQVLLILPLLKRGQVYPFAELRKEIKRAAEYLEKVDEIELPTSTTEFLLQPYSVSEYTFEEIRQLDKEWIPYTRAIGRISAGSIIPYPPGIPLILPGEKITVSKLSQLEEFITLGAAFQGEHRLKESLIYVIK